MRDCFCYSCTFAGFPWTYYLTYEGLLQGGHHSHADNTNYYLTYEGLKLVMCVPNAYTKVTVILPMRD